MSLKKANLILILGLINGLFLSAQDSLTVSSDQELTDIDSLWQGDIQFGEALIIPSYEELLEVYYEAVVEVDRHINYNPYRFHIDNRPSVNDYVYDEVVFPNARMDNLEEFLNSAKNEDPFAADEHEIFLKTRKHIAKYHPELMSTTWDMLPDAPKTEKAEIIHAVDLDLSGIDNMRRRFYRPEKIEKDKVSYQAWQSKLVTSLNASQTAYSNWAKGGLNSFALSGMLLGDLDYVSHDKNMRWENNLDFRLGYVQNEDRPFIKNLDLFQLDTQFAYKAFNKWFYALQAEFTTQFFDGFDIKKDNYEDPISSFLSPAYLKLALGLDYTYATKKNKKLFSLQASPLSYKLTLVSDTATINPSKYGIEDGKRARQEVGGSVQLSSQYTLNNKLTCRSKVLFFSNYSESPENIDINWSSTITYNVSSIFAVTMTLDVVYDDDTDILLSETDDGVKTYGQRLQVKEFLGFGLTYRIM